MVLDKDIITTGHQQEVIYGCTSRSFGDFFHHGCFVVERFYTDKHIAWSLYNSRASCMCFALAADEAGSVCCTNDVDDDPVWCDTQLFNP